MSGPKILLHLEGLAALAVACLAYNHLRTSWWEFALLFLVPDLSMVGYFLGMKTGAKFYNAAHTYLGPLALGAVGVVAGLPILVPICLIWVAHIGFDRLLGYGLKYETDFKDTHLHRV